MSGPVLDCQMALEIAESDWDKALRHGDLVNRLEFEPPLTIDAVEFTPEALAAFLAEIREEQRGHLVVLARLLHETLEPLGVALKEAGDMGEMDDVEMLRDLIERIGAMLAQTRGAEDGD